MKTIVLAIFLLVFIHPLFSQELTRDSLSGTWKVISSQIIPGMDMKLDSNGIKKMEEFRNGFINSKFIFGSDSKFRLELSPASPDFMKELAFLNNKGWMIKNQNEIEIGGKENLMKLIAKELENKIYFLLDESPFLLEVVKL